MKTNRTSKTRTAESQRVTGRPPRVSAAKIAEAALRQGLERATIRTVADSLGMSVTGLYHHVRTREDLKALATAHAIQMLPLPASEGRNWKTWLLEYCRHIFDIMVNHPEFILQIVAGTTHSPFHAKHIEKYLEVMTGAGFSIPDAYQAYVETNSAVVGGAALQAGSRASAAAGKTLFSTLSDVVLASDEPLPLLRELVKEGNAPHPDRWEAVAAAIIVIADRYDARRAKGEVSANAQQRDARRPRRTPSPKG